MKCPNPKQVLKTFTLFFIIRTTITMTSLDFHQCIPEWHCCICPELLPCQLGWVLWCHYSTQEMSLWMLRGLWCGRMYGSFPLTVKGPVHVTSIPQHSGYISVGAEGHQQVSSISLEQDVERKTILVWPLLDVRHKSKLLYHSSP